MPEWDEVDSTATWNSSSCYHVAILSLKLISNHYCSSFYTLPGCVIQYRLIQISTSILNSASRSSNVCEVSFQAAEWDEVAKYRYLKLAQRPREGRVQLLLFACAASSYLASHHPISAVPLAPVSTARLINPGPSEPLSAPLPLEVGSRWKVQVHQCEPSPNSTLAQDLVFYCDEVPSSLQSLAIMIKSA